MRFYITHVRMRQYNDDVSKIIVFKFIDELKRPYQPMSKESLCSWLENNRTIQMYVGARPFPEVEVVNDIYKGKYIRSKGNYTTRDNLLNLPRF